MPKTIFLCYFGDGPFWSDTLYLPSLPSGVSYVHQFRYDDPLVHPDLMRSGVAKSMKEGGLVGSKACLGARFGSAGRKDRLLPVREAEIVRIDSKPGLHQFFFRLGPLYEFGEAHGDLIGHTIQIPSAMQADIGSRLAFAAEIDLPRPVLKTEDEEIEAWSEFVDLVGGDDKAIFHEKARQGIFTRIGIPTTVKRGTFAEPQQLQKSATAAPVFGFPLTEQVEYNLPISYRIPYLFGKNDTPGDFEIGVKSPNKNVEFSLSSISAVGNYGSYNLTVKTLSETSVFDMTISPPASLTSQSTNIIIHSASIKLPMKGRFGLFQAAKRRWLPNLLFFVSLTLLGYISLFEKLISPYLQGQITLSNLLGHWVLLGIVPIASACATLSLQTLKSRA